MRRTAGNLFIFLAAAAFLSQPAPGKDRPYPPGTGIDVSWHSGEIDWETVKKHGFSFIILKATEGVDLKDERFDTWWPRLKEIGVIRGAYHFYVTEDDPGKQASFFIRNVKLEPGDLRPIVDIEMVGHGTEGKLYPKLKEFLDLLEAHYRVKPFIYTSPKFWNRHFHEYLSGYPLWIAEYGVKSPSVPEGWDTWNIWQYSGNASVGGVGKGADLSRFNGGGKAAHRLFIPQHPLNPK